MSAMMKAPVRSGSRLDLLGMFSPLMNAASVRNQRP
jgi:hypothetical protein